MLAVKSRVPQREGCMAVKSAAEQHHSFYLEVHASARPGWDLTGILTLPEIMCFLGVLLG